MSPIGTTAIHRRVARGRFFSWGGVLLWALVEQVYEGNVQPIADLLGTSAPTLARWLYGDARPTAEAKILLASKLALHPSAWTMPPPPRWRLPRVRRLRAAMVEVLRKHPKQRMDQGALGRALDATLDAVVIVARSLQEDELAVVRGATITLVTSSEEAGGLTVAQVARLTGRTKQAVSRAHLRGASLDRVLKTPKGERVLPRAAP